MEHARLHGPGGGHQDDHRGAAAGLHELDRADIRPAAARRCGYRRKPGGSGQHTGNAVQQFFRIIGAGEQLAVQIALFFTGHGLFLHQ